MAEVNVDVAKQSTSEEIRSKSDTIIEKLIKQGNNMTLLNSTFGSDNPISLDNLIINSILGKVHEYDSPGTYLLNIPETINKIKITACGGGGGGSYGIKISGIGYTAGAGGGGGEAILDQEFNVTNTEKIKIIIGNGGKGGGANGKNGSDGEATVIEGLVTLSGGKGAKVADTTDTTITSCAIGGEPGGPGGGNGGNGGYFTLNPNTWFFPSASEDGVLGKGGYLYTIQNDNTCYGGSGGGSLGDGGDGGYFLDSSGTEVLATEPTRGGGGGGLGMCYGNHLYTHTTSGASGYVKIVWGY